jgi:uncharacterized protein with GYD domain
MALYMYQASYTAKSMAAQLKEPQDPVEAMRRALEDLGAEIVVAGFPFGEYDVLLVYEAPDDLTAASVAMAVAAEGEVKSAKTTRLLSGQEWLESLRKRRIVNTRKRASHTTVDQLPELLSRPGGEPAGSVEPAAAASAVVGPHLTAVDGDHRLSHEPDYRTPPRPCHQIYAQPRYSGMPAPQATR